MGTKVLINRLLGPRDYAQTAPLLVKIVGWLHIAQSILGLAFLIVMGFALLFGDPVSATGQSILWVIALILLGFVFGVSMMTSPRMARFVFISYGIGEATVAVFALKRSEVVDAIFAAACVAFLFYYARRIK